VVRIRIEEKRPLRFLITDLDNTLFDWVEIWYKSFTAQLNALVVQGRISEAQLLNEFKTVHQKHGTSEYGFAIFELPSLRRAHLDPAQVYFTAWEALNRARDDALQLYPGVRETLLQLKRRGCTIVGYTESMPLYTKYRVIRLELDGLIDYLYTPPNHPLPADVPDDFLAPWSDSSLKLSNTKHRLTPAGELKPNPAVLRDIMNDVGATAETTAYVGDSKLKDVAMAQRAGVVDVWAKYGIAQHREQYELLRAVTHWTPEAVERERAYAAPREPTITLEQSFAELLKYFVPASSGIRARA
jgi:phosphoglycolate phosphatase-like HAD superfamily hydrolase